MKILILAAFIAVASAKSSQHILGDKECTHGPSYWCKNLQTASQCGSVEYCKERVWPKQIKTTTCDSCKEVVGVVHAYLANNLTETEVIQALDALCSFVGSYGTECKALVNTYAKEIMTMVSQYTANPAMICQMMGLCKAEGSVEVQNMMKMQKAMPIIFAAKQQLQQPGSSALCIVCEFAMTKLDGFLETGASEAKITSYVEKVCSYLPATIKTECDALIVEYGKEIIQLLVNQLKPKTICTEIKLCSASGVKMVYESKPKAINAQTCELCELLVTYAEKMINNNTEAEIEQLLDQICSYLGSAKAECQSIVNTYVPTIIALLKQEMTPALVCKEIGLCTSSKPLVKKLQKMSKKQLVGGIECEACQYVVSYVESLLNTKTEAEIVAMADKLCAHLGSYKTECDALIKSYLPEIIELLKKELSPALVCKELGLCTAMKKFMSKINPSAIGNGTYCAYCKLLVTYADNLLKDQKTEAEITAVLEELCSYLGTYKAECTSLMTAYLPLVFKYLAQELSPDLVCKEIGLCTASKSLSLKAIKMTKATKKVVDGVECEACEYVVSYVESLLNTKTEAEIVTMADKLCSYLGSYKAECDALIKSYLPEIIELLKKELSPALVCKELGLCTAMKKFMRKSHLSAIGNGTYCAYCKLIVTYADNMLKNEKTEAEITAVLEQLCSYLGTYKAECTSLMTAYLPLVFKYLAQELSPDLVCKELGLCTAAKKLEQRMVMKMTKAKKVNGVECEACEYLVGYVEGLLNTKTEAEIVAMADELCAYVGPYKTECQTIVKSYLPQIIELLKKEVTPALVCKELGLCTSVKKLMAAVKVTEFRAGSYCTICKVLVGYVDAQLKNKATETEITAGLEKLCSYLGSYQASCKSYMTAYLPMVFKYLAQEMTPDLVCKELTLCASKARTDNKSFNKFLRV